jgi:hypothetical protein
MIIKKYRINKYKIRTGFAETNQTRLRPLKRWPAPPRHPTRTNQPQPVGQGDEPDAALAGMGPLLTVATSTSTNVRSTIQSR